HWWFEGPMWIDFLIRKIAYDQKTVKLATPSDYLREYPANQMSVPSTSTWGYKGYNEAWLEGSNDWIYRHLHVAGERMKELAEKFADSKDNSVKRALNQAARELLLAQASDWPFIMKTGTMVEYAQKSVKLHINRFTHIYRDLLNGSIDKDWLKEVESRDNIFSDMDCAKYYNKTYQAAI
ncbi:MAG: 1,4-alpha-glucan branching protein domain-containing protein, partial [Candidatus Omnitrophota bacterium]